MVLFRSLFLSFAICAFLTYCIIIIYDDQELNSQHQGTVENIHEHVETVLINERHNTAKHSKESLNNTKICFKGMLHTVCIINCKFKLHQRNWKGSNQPFYIISVVNKLLKNITSTATTIEWNVWRKKYCIYTLLYIQ